MSETQKTTLAFGVIFVLLMIIGFAQSWNVALGISWTAGWAGASPWTAESDSR